MNKVAFATLGCKVNQYDTDVMKTSFLKRGYSFVDFSEKADVYIVNTCTVTGTAARKSRQMASRARRNNPGAVVVVTGCLGQLDSSALMKLTGADIVTGNVEKHRIADIVGEYSGKREIIAADVADEFEYTQAEASTQDSRTRVYIKIQDGCDNYCSYCTIPFARGPSRSRKPGEILSEIKRYASEGTREVVLVGIHLDSYGKDSGDADITDLLYGIEEIDGISRVRLGSIEPSSVTEDFVAKASAASKLCHHFHMSLQSGCDATLGRMGRNYSTADFRRAAMMLGDAFGDAAFTTDVITGFPGETDEEFKESIGFVKSVGFMKIHVFRYSPRKGTAAYAMKDRVPGDVKKSRSEELMEISRVGFRSFAGKMRGSAQEVLVEKRSNEYPGKWEGHTGNYVKTLFDCGQCRPGDLVKVDFMEIEDDFVHSCLHEGKGV